MVEIPDGSWLIIAAFLGLLPTGIDVSLQASEWGKAKKKGMSKIRDRMESMGLANRFDPFAPNRDDLSVDTSKMLPRTRRVLPKVVQDRHLGFPRGSRDLLRARVHFPSAGGRVALSEPGRGPSGHG